MANTYTLPKLSYSYNALEPFLSEEQLKIHHTKHHQTYVDATNALLGKLDESRKTKTEIDMKSTLKSLSFNLSGNILHEKFWENIAPKGKTGKPSNALKKAIEKDFESIEQFKKEFSTAAKTTEGSGWAALAYCKKHDKLLIMQIEKHNVNIYPMFQLLLVLDVWEHAYYLDYKNDRAKYVDTFWDYSDWNAANKRFGGSEK